MTAMSAPEQPATPPTPPTTASAWIEQWSHLVAQGGVLLYETFAAGNERVGFGKPSNPNFLLNPGELLDAVRGRLRVIAYQDGFINVPRASCVQRIVAAAPLQPTPTGLTERNN